MIRLKAAALAGVLLVGLLAVMPLVTVAPEPEEDFKECADNGVCFILQLTNEEVSLSGPPDFTEGSNNFDAWLYVRNPSENIERSLATGGGGEDNVVAESLTITVTDVDGTVFIFLETPESGFFPERWDPVVHAFETQRVFFVGFGFTPDSLLGDVLFVYELALTFRGESFTLAIDFEIEVVDGLDDDD